MKDKKKYYCRDHEKKRKYMNIDKNRKKSNEETTYLPKRKRRGINKKKTRT